MKTMTRNFTQRLFIPAAILMAVTFIQYEGFSQDNPKKKEHKIITMKIVSDDNGKKTVIDTTLVVNDSTMEDSVERSIERAFELKSDGKHGCFKIKELPEGFDYQFNVPCMPECGMALDELKKLNLEGFEPGYFNRNFDWEDNLPELDYRLGRSRGTGQTLADLVGDIPMDRVVSYSIKDRKNGKRIIIDVEDAPLFEKNQDRVVIIKTPALKDQSVKPKHKVKVYVNGDEGAKSNAKSQVIETTVTTTSDSEKDVKK